MKGPIRTRIIICLAAVCCAAVVIAANCLWTEQVTPSAKSTKNEMTIKLDLDGNVISCAFSSGHNPNAPRDRIRCVIVLENVGQNTSSLQSLVLGASFDIRYRSEDKPGFISLFPPGTYVKPETVDVGPGQKLTADFDFYLGQGRYELYCDYVSGSSQSLEWRGISQTNVAILKIAGARSGLTKWIEAIGERIHVNR